MKVLTPAFAQKFLAAALVACVAPLAHATAFNAVTIASGTSGELTQTGSGGYVGVSNQFSSDANSAGSPNGGGYNFIFTSPAAAVAGAPSSYSPPNVAFWSVPTNSTSLGATTGALLALDSDFNTLNINSFMGAPVFDTVDGLTVGQSYIISFNAADGQQTGFAGQSQDYVHVCVGSSCFNTSNVVDASESSTPWVANSFTFTATATSETLSLLGVGGSTGTPSNVPAFALVDDLSITQAPEPNSLLLMGTGLAGLGGLLRSRFAKKA